MEKISEPVANKKKKVLIVDDDEIHLEMTRNILGSKYEVTTVKSGKDALALFYKGFIPNLILLDIIMPHMDGWDAFGRLKAISTLHEVPIAFFTSSRQTEDRNRAKEMGAIDYIMKPFQTNDLLARVEKILG